MTRREVLAPTLFEASLQTADLLRCEILTPEEKRDIFSHEMQHIRAIFKQPDSAKLAASGGITLQAGRTDDYIKGRWVTDFNFSIIGVAFPKVSIGTQISVSTAPGFENMSGPDWKSLAYAFENMALPERRKFLSGLKTDEHVKLRNFTRSI